MTLSEALAFVVVDAGRVMLVETGGAPVLEGVDVVLPETGGVTVVEAG